MLSGKKTWRFLPHQFLSCYENMALDEYLVDFHEKTRIPVLRFYGWSPPAISIGKYQRASDDLNREACGRDAVPVVRRMTGGGAIMHDGEFTYSLVCSEDDIGCQGLPVRQTFEKLNRFLLNLYRSLGLNALYARDYSESRPARVAAPFCFGGNEEFDIVVNGKKLGGNAQRRKREILFQHGSIPFESSGERVARYFTETIPFENYTTLCTALDRSIGLAEVALKFMSAFEQTVGAELKADTIDDQELAMVAVEAQAKASVDIWNEGSNK